MQATLGVAFAGGGLTSIRHYTILRKDTLLSSLLYMRKCAEKNLCILVLDNLETIFNNQKLMEELANIIILCDDSRYAKYNIKILLVGTPSGVLEYFSKTQNVTTVANRMKELSEIARFSPKQVADLVENGLKKLLKIKIGDYDLEKAKSHIYGITLGVPQKSTSIAKLLDI